jgi:hypothetical protein
MIALEDMQRSSNICIIGVPEKETKQRKIVNAKSENARKINLKSEFRTGWSSVTERLPSTCRSLGSIPSAINNLKHALCIRENMIQSIIYFH